MSQSDEEQELFLLWLLLDDTEKPVKKKRKIWVRSIYKKRKYLGTYQNLVQRAETWRQRILFQVSLRLLVFPLILD